MCLETLNEWKRPKEQRYYWNIHILDIEANKETMLDEVYFAVVILGFGLKLSVNYFEE